MALISKFLSSTDSWISALESDSMKQADDSHPSQNFVPSETPLSAGALDVRPTQTQAGGQVGAAQSDWNFAGSKVTPTTRREKNHFHDINIIESNAQSTQGNTSSSNQRPEQFPPNNSSPVNPVTSAQVVNGNSVAPSSGTNGVSSSAPVTSPNQAGGNQGNEVSGANSLAPVTSASQVGGTSSSGTSGANGSAPVTSLNEVGGAPPPSTNGASSSAPETSPNQFGGNQSKGVPGAVSPPAGGAISPNKAATSRNSGATAGSTGKSVGVPTNLAQSNGEYHCLC